MNKKLFFAITLISACSFVFAQKYEAENGDMFGTKISSEKKGFTGDGYVNFLSYDSSCVGINVNIDEDSDYVLIMNVLNQDEEKRVSVKIEYDENGFVCAQKIDFSKDFTDVYVNNSVYLTKGEHSIYVTGLSGEWSLNSLEVKKATKNELKKIAPPKNLVTKNPSKEAKALYDYLCEMRGKGILSGQQVYTRTPEMTVINKETGKYPAILGIDLIEYSPSRVAHGSRGSIVNDAKKWAKEGGIISCCWHWNAPKGYLVEKDEDYKRWYDGFRTSAANFNFGKGIHDHETDEYKAMISDIDAIARQLKVLQRENIPVLWRPVHEASGGWFWWGARGKDNYIELYKLIFDRLVNYHGINNLIWVWNAQDPDWYPGDEYVDVISYDTYPGKREYKPMHDELIIIQSATSQAKLCALSENGPLPDIEALANEKSLWSWFCTWDGEFVMKNNKYSSEYTDLETFKRFYENDYLITRDELPDIYKNNDAQ